jgi:hypothetical protein
LAREQGQAVGVGVDAQGGAVIDPTANVISLNEAANKRQDDLRQLNNERINAEIRVLGAQMDGLEKRMLLRAEHAREIRMLNDDRLENVRQVDVLASNLAAQRALTATETLAAQTTAERETLRSMVENTAKTIAAQSAENFNQMNNRLAQLERTSYEGAGKGTGTKNTVTYAIIAIGALVSLITIGSVVIAIAFAIRR